MVTLIIETLKAISILSLVAAAVIITAVASWRVIYYGFGCRRNPIQKAAILTATVLWIVSTSIINHL